MPLNTTGTANTQNYVLGRGILHAADLIANDTPYTYTDLGNCPEFSTSMNLEELKHTSSRAGVKVTDASTIISEEMTIAWTLDELSLDNLADWFIGTTSTPVNAANAGATTFAVTDALPPLGKWYTLMTTAGLRFTNLDGSKLAMTQAGAVPALLVEDTDYILNSAFGAIFLLTTSPTINGTNNQGIISAVVTADATVNTTNDVAQAFTGTSVRKAIVFRQINAMNNDRAREYLFHKVQSQPTGDLAGISDEVSTLGFTGTAERNVLGKTLTITEPSLT